MSAPLSILDYRQPVEFRIGEVIVRSWTILSRHFLTFVILVGIAELLPLVLNLYFVSGREVTTVTDIQVWPILIGLLTYILAEFAHAIVIFAAFQDLRGRPVNAGESMGQGVARLFPILVASVLVGLLVFMGMLLCLIPGLIALTAMAVVVPACVVERLGPIESMSRSADLTTGHRWPILGVAFAWGVIVIVVTIAIAAAMQGTSSLATQILTWIWQVLSGSFTAVYSAILYHDLRAVREGIGIDEIASVFD